MTELVNIVRLGRQFGVGLTSAEIVNVERRLGFTLPECIKEAYQQANGGIPDPTVFETDTVDTVVAEFLPLVSGSTEHSAEVLMGHVRAGPIHVPERFLPFAEDAGGDFFLADCSTDDGRVYLRRHDTIYPEDMLFFVGFDFRGFWTALKQD